MYGKRNKKTMYISIDYLNLNDFIIVNVSTFFDFLQYLMQDSQPIQLSQSF